jgi:hypothetical protein
MLKKVIFAAALALGFVTSFNVGAAVDTGSSASCGPSGDCCPRDPITGIPSCY